jgi:hypothetical protein
MYYTYIFLPPFSSEPHPYKEEDAASEGTNSTLPRESETRDFHGYFSYNLCRTFSINSFIKGL